MWMKKSYSFRFEERYFLVFLYLSLSGGDLLSSDGWCISFKFLKFSLNAQEQADRGDLESLCHSVAIAGAADSVDIGEYFNPISIWMFSYSALRSIASSLTGGRIISRKSLFPEKSSSLESCGTFF